MAEGDDNVLKIQDYERTLLKKIIMIMHMDKYIKLIQFITKWSKQLKKKKFHLDFMVTLTHLSSIYLNILLFVICDFCLIKKCDIISKSKI